VTTRHSHEGDIRRLGSLSARKLDSELLEHFYARLRKEGGASGKPM